MFTQKTETPQTTRVFDTVRFLHKDIVGRGPQPYLVFAPDLPLKIHSWFPNELSFEVHMHTFMKVHDIFLGAIPNCRRLCQNISIPETFQLITALFNEVVRSLGTGVLEGTSELAKGRYSMSVVKTNTKRSL